MANDEHRNGNLIQTQTGVPPDRVRNRMLLAQELKDDGILPNSKLKLLPG